MSNTTAFIGIDPTNGMRSMTCAVLTSDLRVQTLTTAPAEVLLHDILAQAESAICGINGPSGPNRALLTEPAYRERVGLDPARTNYSNYRVCEYELRRRGIFVSYTPPGEDRVPAAVQDVWQVYERLRGMGYTGIGRPGSRHLFETNAQAIYTVLINGHPYSKTSLEGQLQRQLILHEQGIRIPDPIYTLQEWTRHRLLTGTVNMQDVLSPGQLDALAAAYTAYVIANDPERIVEVGDESEGQIVLPVARLAEAY